jgi:phosphoglycerate kinase
VAWNSLSQAQLQDKKILVRFDFNVPLDGTTITDTTRVDACLKTIQHCLTSGAKKLVLMSHLGRPKGKVCQELSLEPVATYIADKLGEEVTLTESCTDAGIKTLLSLPNTKIILLQNLRFHSEEETNSADFAKILSSYGDLYVNDAFGTCHRKHASTHGIMKFFKSKDCFVGPLIESEVAALNNILEAPKKPFVSILGGAKVSDKIKIINRLLPQVDHMLIGGAMAYPFLAAKGIAIGNSLCNEEDVKLAKMILNGSGKEKIRLPLDHVTSKSIDGEAKQCSNQDIDDNEIGLDIGERTIREYCQIISKGKTILWNGPMGLFEKEQFSKGTFSLAQAISENIECYSLVGGGDSVNAINKSGLSSKISHVSTGGGASLEFIEEGSLPGINALKFGVNA